MSACGLELDLPPREEGWPPDDVTVMIASFFGLSKLWIDTVTDSILLYFLL